MNSPSFPKRSLPDFAACLFLLALIFLFYRPETDFLHSHYAAVSVVFERAGRLVNPDYTDHFQNLRAESCWPLPHLVAHGWMRIFHADLECALLFFHSTFLLLSLFATYWANRLFFPRTAAFALTLLLLFGRILLPLGRGIGMTSVPLLLPLLLFFVHNLARSQDTALSPRQRILPAGIMAFCLGCMLTLGGHETIFAIAFFAVFLPLLTIEWLNRRRIAKHFLPGPTLSTLLAAILGIALAATLMLASRQVVAPEQDRASLWETVTFSYIGRETKIRILEEPGIIRGHRKRVFRGTFIEGRFLTIEPGKFYHRHEERTFLYPGRGFNGIIPLAIIPGCLLGMFLLAKKIFLLFRQRERQKAPSRREKHFLLLLVTLLIHFAGILCITATPKPSRFSLSIYAILVCGVYGYVFLFSLCMRVVGNRLGTLAWPDEKRRRVALWAAVLVVLFPLLLCLETRLLKNYRDLQDYVGEYWIEARTKAMEPVFFAARNAFASKNVYVIYYWKNYPEQGLLLRYRPLDNVEMYSTLEEAGEIDPEGIYYVWQDLGRLESHFRVFLGKDLLETLRKNGEHEDKQSSAHQKHNPNS